MKIKILPVLPILVCMVLAFTQSTSVFAKGGISYPISFAPISSDNCPAVPMPGNYVTATGISEELHTGRNISSVAKAEADTQGPVLIDISPANGASNVSPLTNLVFTFNEPVIKREGNVTVTSGDYVQIIDIHSDMVQLSADRRTVTVSHEDFPSGAVISVLIEAYTFVNDAGNVFEGLYDWTFTTRSAESAVVSFTLVNADTNEDIQTINTGDIIDYANLPTQNLSIRANTTGKVGSVVFYLNDRQVQVENIVPYAIGGDSPQGDYTPWLLPIGQHTLMAAPHPNRAGQGQAGSRLSVEFRVVGYITSFTLVNAETNEDLQPITEGDVINLSALPTRDLSIRANTNPGRVGSVVFWLNNKRVKVENVAPYAIAGDDPQGNYNAWTPPVGQHTLIAIPYSHPGGRGTNSRYLAVNFQVTEGAATAMHNTDKEIIPGTGRLLTSPNPFAERTQVEFSVPESNLTILDVYDTRGSFITRLFEGNAEGGKVYSLGLDGGKMQNGMYLIRLVSGSYATNRKLIVAK